MNHYFVYFHIYNFFIRVFEAHNKNGLWIALKKDGTIQDDVIIQTGFSTYEPKYCQWSKLIPYQQMVKNVADARIVITHGGPASFIMPLQVGKTPIVVPRQHQFNEHVNDHQVLTFH